MLAQNFKTAEELGLYQDQLDGLKLTLVYMETGKVKHYDGEFIAWVEPGEKLDMPKFAGLFNMSCWAADSPCGTVGCIAGNAELISGCDLSGMTHCRNPAANDLFMASGAGKSWDKITVEEGAQALRNFLTFGDAKWNEVCPC